MKKMMILAVMSLFCFSLNAQCPQKKCCEKSAQTEQCCKKNRKDGKKKGCCKGQAQKGCPKAGAAKCKKAAGEGKCCKK